MWTHRTLRLRSPYEGTDASVFVRDAGSGPAVLLLHGGWGYEAYSFDAVAASLVASGFRCIAPDRIGYGRSSRLSEQPIDFHTRAADETLGVMDALGLRSAAAWGHSDGAVIAAWLGIRAPARVSALVLESLHAWGQKPGSRRFFEGAAASGVASVGRTRDVLERDHGESWAQIVEMNGRVWVELGQRSKDPHEDLYGGRLKEIRAPTLLVHGRQDPRTEPGEADWATATIPGARLVWFEQARHAPHAESLYRDDCANTVARFLMAGPGRA